MHHVENNLAKHRRKVTIMIAVLSILASGVSFILMRLRFSHMHIIFYLVLGLSFLLATYLILWTLGAHGRYTRLAMILRRCYMICLAVGLAFFLVMQGLIISGARTEEAEVDAVIVLGAGLINNTPSLILASRLDAAIEYLKTHGNIPVIVSGGLGRGEIITEAEAMSRYLVARGVDESRVWKEEASTSTYENLRFSMFLMKEKGLDIENIRVAVVSNEFHLYRARVIAGKAGLDAIGVAAETPGLHRRVLYYFREAFALASELFL